MVRICQYHRYGITREFCTSTFEISCGWAGTKSIRAAIDILGGVHTKHCLMRGCKHCYDNATRQFLENNCAFEIYHSCDYASNFPWVHWKQLAETYPESRFVLPRRNIDDWMEKSQNKSKNIRKRMKRTITQPIGFSGLVVFKMYGQMKYDKGLWRERQLKHVEDILDFFKGTDRLLQLNVFEDDDKTKWKKLGGFFNKPIPDIPFPHLK